MARLGCNSPNIAEVTVSSPAVLIPRLSIQRWRQRKLVENRLTALSGEKFDKQYVEQIAERARKGEHKLLLQVGAKAQDMELKNYATKTLAVIESQQQLVKDTSRSIESGSHGKSDSGASSGGGMREKSRPAYGQ